MNKRWIVLVIVICVFGQGMAQEAQFRGPDRSGIFPDTALLKQWPEEGPEQLFVAGDLGRAYSSAVVSDGRIFVTGTSDSLEVLTALDMQGERLWQVSYGLAWNQSFPEARCTPTIEDERLYVLTGLDELSCLSVVDGKPIWQVNMQESYGSNLDMFGVSESLLLSGDKIIVSPCGDLTTVVALDKMTGELVWKSEALGAQRSNISPQLIHHCDKEYIISATRTHVISVDAETGELMWTHHHNMLNEEEQNTTILTNVPTYHDSCLWITSGWDTPSDMLELAPDGRSVSVKFRDRTFDNQNHGVILLDGYLYGSNFTGRNTGRWVCMNWDTGEILWVADWNTKGPVIAADGMLYLLDERRGNMALVSPDPDKFEMISTFRVKEGKGPFWARPSIYEGMLLVRHGEKLVAYSLR